MENIYIHKMPCREREKLCVILNSGDTWRTLGRYMNYSDVDLNQFGMQVHRPGADAIISSWGQLNHTVLELWNLLKYVL